MNAPVDQPDARVVNAPDPRHLSPRDLPVAIIGAGFAGIAAAVQLEKAGFRDFTIFERADEIGGTWRENTYPGAACDVPSHLYSLSFEPHAGWQSRYASADEIQAYLLRVVEKWGLRDRLRTGTEICEARYDEERGEWELRTAGGELVSARAVFACLGGLSEPRAPRIPGLADFGGELFHTARWRHDYALEGRRVAVVGTGASAVQVVPAIAPRVEQLSVFQRTPAWVVPKLEREYRPAERARFERWPALLRLSRTLKYLRTETLGPMIFLDAPRLSARGERMSLAHLEAQVRDPALRARLTPDFQFGCKRILISDDYWASFERDNVELVTEPIERLTRTGVRTADGAERDFDAVVLATGFAASLATPRFPVTGRGGLTLEQAWKDGGVAYKGLAVSGFPNYFLLMGPNTGPGHTSVLLYTEAQIHHALGALRLLRDEGVKSVEVRREVQDRYNAGLQGRMKHMVWSSGCTSWYLSEDGSNHTLFPGLAGEYVLRTRRFRRRDYTLER